MTNYEWNEDFYQEIVKDHNYRFPKYNSIDYPFPKGKEFQRNSSPSMLEKEERS